MALPTKDARPDVGWPSAIGALSSIRAVETTYPTVIEISKLPEPCHDDVTRAKYLAGFLVDLSEHLPTRGFPGQQFDLSMGRHAIGKHLGLAPQMVTRLFTRMQQDGLLKVNGRQISICKPESLYALAGLRPLHGLPTKKQVR